jgi:hypothetical protein
MDEERHLVYKIVVGGKLDHRWADWFDGVQIAIARCDPPRSLLTCTVVDQSALYGILDRIRDLNLPLIEVRLAGPKGSDLDRGERYAWRHKE